MVCTAFAVVFFAIWFYNAFVAGSLSAFAIGVAAAGLFFYAGLKQWRRLR